ncbi:aspartyl/asparaginyl beta-hydroxylase domain-containing protein [Enhygromyxa salina]|nr:aspartyl/asparaginyl beta-hydroxylase domain-containing protein [Enhygromyxa salina]
MSYDPNPYAFTDMLAQRWTDIRDEYLGLDQQLLGQQNLASVKGWRGVALYFLGGKKLQNCLHAPLTTKIAEEVPFMTSAGFAVLDDGAHYAPHIDKYPPHFEALLDARWGASLTELRRVHLPLIAAPGSRMRVGEETREFVPGEVLIFQNSAMTHEVFNDSGKPRVIMLIDFLTRAPHRAG